MARNSGRGPRRNVLFARRHECFKARSGLSPSAVLGLSPIANTKEAPMADSVYIKLEPVHMYNLVE